MNSTGYGDQTERLIKVFIEMETMKPIKRRFQKKVPIILVVILVFQLISGCMEQKPPLTITGCILSEDGSHIPDVKVTYLQHETSTDAEGCFSLEVPPGTGSLSLNKEGFIPIQTVVTVSDSLDVGTIVLPKMYVDITVVEEVIDYEHGSAAGDVIHYYSTAGFDEQGTIKVEYATITEPMHITVLVTSTQSAFVIEHDGALGIMFDFSEKHKELYMGDIIFTTAFGGEWDVHLFSEQELVWNSEDDEEFRELFSEKMEEDSEAAEFIRKIENIVEDSVHPDVFRAPGFKVHTASGLSFGVEDRFYRTGWNFKETVHLSEEKEPVKYSVKFADFGHSPQQLEFVSTLVHALRWVINPPNRINLPPINWVRKELARALKELHELHQKYGKDIKKRLEDSKKDLEKQKKDSENRKKELEKQKEELKKHKENLEKSKKELEDLKKEHEKLKEELKYYGGEVKRIESEIEKLEKTIKELEDSIKNIDNETKKLDDETKKLDDETKKLGDDIKKLEDTIKMMEKRLKEIEESIKVLDRIISDC